MAAVVVLFASAYRVKVAAYGTATTHARHVKRMPRSNNNALRISAATPLRRHDTCQPVSDDNFIATPPVENNSAPVITNNLALSTLEIPHGRGALCRPNQMPGAASYDAFAERAVISQLCGLPGSLPGTVRSVSLDK